VPPTEVECLKKELANLAQTLETTLNANTSLSEKMKELTDVHSRCGSLKETLENKIVNLTNA